jgi:FAD/FMN-containing dehydrogenase
MSSRANPDRPRRAIEIEPRRILVTTTPQTTIDIAQLRAAVGGQVMGPKDADYEHARLVFYAKFDERRPAVIVRPADASDVAYVVSLARESGLELAVRSGGHSSAGHGVSDGGIVLDLSLMKGLEIDPAGRTAWVETGLTAGEATDAFAAHGLALGFGDTGSVGIGGLTLGGGVGYLVRKHGLTIDDLLAADVVTADGELVRVDEKQNADLFWALRGGGGNFGVATRFRYRLHPVDTVTGGMLVLPATPEVVASFVEAADAAPEELSAIANVMPAPPMPFLPEERVGELVVLAMMVHSGPLDDGERAMAPFRALATPVADLVRPMPYREMFQPDEAGFRPHAIGRTLFLDRFDRDVAETALEHIRASSAQLAVTQLRVLGGAMARVPSDATAFAHRRRRIMVALGALYATAEEAPIHKEWAEDGVAALRQSDSGAYVNFLGDEGDERVRDAYPGSTWDRLAAIKRRYDPTNVFRMNQNVPPEGSR